MERQLKYWSKDFTELRDFNNILPEIIELEIDKYEKIKKNMGKIVSSYLRRGYKPNLDLLIELYDSHGIHPDYANEYLLKEKGVEIKVPFNFTELVAKKHLSEKKIEKKKMELPSDLPKTIKLYYKDQYLRSSYGKILFKGGDFLILDKTIFYPTGGGQVHDTGEINKNGSRLKVIDVREEDGYILHFVRGDLADFNVGDEVELHINWGRRYSLMKHHTSTHILLQALKRILGPHVWQAGVLKEVEYAHLDITHYTVPDETVIEELENVINKIVSDNRFVYARYVDRGEAEKRYGISIYQGGVIPGRKLRIVEVDGWDIEACGGTHVRRTGEIQLIKITNVEKLQDGIIRFTYVAGDKALKYLQELHGQVTKLSNLLNIGYSEIYDSLKSLIEEKERLESENRRMMESLAEYKSRLLMKESLEINGIKVIFSSENNVDLAIKIGEYMDKIGDRYIYISWIPSGKGVNIIVRVGESVKNSYPAHNLASLIGKSALTKFGGKGDEKYFRLGGLPKDDIGDLLDSLKDLVVKYVKEG